MITTAGDERKLEKARELGADYTIDHYKQKISDEVKRITNRRGVDIVFEHVGMATWPESLQVAQVRRYAGHLWRDDWIRAKLDLRVLFARQLTIVRNLYGLSGRAA